MRKTLIALMFAAALPTVAMAMPEGGPRHDGPHHRGDAPFHQLDLSRDQRQQIGKLMGEQMHDRKQLVEKYLEKLPAADQKALKDEMTKDVGKYESFLSRIMAESQRVADKSVAPSTSADNNALNGGVDSAVVEQESDDILAAIEEAAMDDDADAAEDVLGSEGQL